MANIDQEEIWKDIEGYPTYQVSSEGNVRRLGNEKTRKTKILKVGKTIGGYLRVGIWKDSKQKYFYVHRLVAQAFLFCKNKEYLEINHIDEDKTNNRVNNLEYCNRAYNNTFGTRIQRVVEKKSKPVKQMSLSGELIKTWPSSAEAGRNGYEKSTVAACCRGKLKTYRGFKWEYA